LLINLITKSFVLCNSLNKEVFNLLKSRSKFLSDFFSKIVSTYCSLKNLSIFNWVSILRGSEYNVLDKILYIGEFRVYIAELFIFVVLKNFLFVFSNLLLAINKTLFKFLKSILSIEIFEVE
jgi:hypothetical protein